MTDTRALRPKLALQPKTLTRPAAAAKKRSLNARLKSKIAALYDGQQKKKRREKIFNKQPAHTPVLAVRN